MVPWKEDSAGRQDTWFSILVLPLKSCVSLGMSPSLVQSAELTTHNVLLMLSVCVTLIHSPLYQPWDSSPAPGSPSPP